MTEPFTASNGVTVKEVGAGLYVEGDGVRLDRLREKLQAGSYGDVTPAMQVALREFFQHERDKEQGVWRWPENPSFVAWASRRSNEKDVTVLDESSGYVGYFTRGDVADVRPGVGLIRGAARAYFEAHPERKPWEDAQPGEVWVLAFDGEEDTFKAYESRYGTIYFTRSRETSTDLADERITAGRRIWPEDAS